jgi:hypothetical protein
MLLLLLLLMKRQQHYAPLKGYFHFQIDTRLLSDVYFETGDCRMCVVEWRCW